LNRKSKTEEQVTRERQKLLIEVQSLTEMIPQNIHAATKRKEGKREPASCGQANRNCKTATHDTH
jgi:hypothetical protein